MPLLDVMMMLRFGQSSVSLARSILNSSNLCVIRSSALSKQSRNFFV